MKGKNKLTPRLLGITKDSVVRVDEKTKEVGTIVLFVHTIRRPSATDLHISWLFWLCGHVQYLVHFQRFCKVIAPFHGKGVHVLQMKNRVFCPVVLPASLAASKQDDFF